MLQECIKLNYLEEENLCSDFSLEANIKVTCSRIILYGIACIQSGMTTNLKKMYF